MQKTKKIINFVNFVRGSDNLYSKDILLEALRKELQYLKAYNLRSTVLLQYDALMDKDFRDLIAEYNQDGFIEIGLWIELVRSAYFNAGVEWKGRDYEWDWEAQHCTLLGQAPEDRIKLIDEIMRAFKEHYGSYPAVVGQWVIDTVSLNYMYENYGVKGFCMCKDQDGTDTFTLWGGYLFGAYYPSKNNMYVPAQSKENQVNAPMFRMLGSDPIYQYDVRLSEQDGPILPQTVISLEPIYFNGGGGWPKWVDWYLKENFSDKALNFAYAQTGQENSFSWPKIVRGYPYQVDTISTLAKSGALEVQQFGETVEWFKNTYQETPPTSSIAESDWKGEGRKTYWYENKNYRINLQKEEKRTWIRDWYIFNENYQDRYTQLSLKTTKCYYDNLPVTDGYRWTGNGVRSGIFFLDENGEELFGDTLYEKGEKDVSVQIQAKQTLGCNFNENTVSIRSDKAFILQWRADDTRMKTQYSVIGNTIKMYYEGFDYSLEVENGVVSIENGKPIVRSVENTIILKVVR